MEPKPKAPMTAPANRALASLIVSTRNRPTLVADLVESVLQGEEVPSEIVIVDQSSVANPSLSNWIPKRGCQLRYVWTPSVGVSRGRNAAMAAARHDMLVITDDDMLAAPDWFGRMVRTLVEAGPQSVIVGQVLTGQPENGGAFSPTLPVPLRGSDRKVYRGPIGADVLASGNMAAFRSAFEKVGDFDTRLGPGTPFPGAEDNDLGFRLLEAGYQVIYEPQAVLYHRAWRPNRDWMYLCWNYARGQGAFYAKHMSWRHRYTLARLQADLQRHSGLLMQRVWHERGLALGNLAWIVGLLYGALRWKLTTRSAQSSDLHSSS
jgi:O-antigen biosynthesis protein